MEAVFVTLGASFTITFDQAMDENPAIDPTRWVVQTGAQNRYGTTAAWTSATTLRLNTFAQMGPVTPVQGIYSGQLSLPNVQSLAGLPLANQVFPVSIV